MVEVARGGSRSLEVTDVHSRSLEVARKLSETVCNGLSYISTEGIAVVTELRSIEMICTFADAK